MNDRLLAKFFESCGIVLLCCCHVTCLCRYVNPEYFAAHGFDACDFARMCRMSSWVNAGHSRVRACACMAGYLLCGSYDMNHTVCRLYVLGRTHAGCVCCLLCVVLHRWAVAACVYCLHMYACKPGCIVTLLGRLVSIPHIRIARVRVWWLRCMKLRPARLHENRLQSSQHPCDRTTQAFAAAARAAAAEANRRVSRTRVTLCVVWC